MRSASRAEPLTLKLQGPVARWVVEADPDKADFIIATERSRCGDGKPLVLIDEVKRFDRTFAWVYARRADDK